jgi:hypothetical protein
VSLRTDMVIPQRNGIVHATAFVVFALVVGAGACAPKPCESLRSRAPAVTAPDEPPDLGYEDPDATPAGVARWATPRCLATDARCGPDAPGDFGACYRSGVDRIPLTDAPGGWYILPNRNDAPCTYDGECRLAACEELCTNYGHQPPPMVECRHELRQVSSVERTCTSDARPAPSRSPGTNAGTRS